jgi:glycosyltransferase involved in cell wall biosynthesis
MNRSSLKVLLVTHYYPKHRGGVEIVAGKIIEKLIQDYNVSVVWIASNTDAKPENSLSLNCCPVFALNFLEKYLQIPYPIWSLSALIKIWKWTKESDLIHLHDYLYMGNIIAFILAKICKKPIIITQHIGSIPYQNIFLRGLLSKLNQTIGSWMINSAEQVIFISEGVKSYFIKFSSFSHSPLLIPNGVETITFCPVSWKERIQIRQRFSFAAEDTIYLFVGRFVEKKGLPILYQLALSFPHIHWCFAGWGPLDPEAWQLPNVSVFKDLDSVELVPIYQMADLLVLPSKGEGFPLVVQEAMACGTPVMVSPEVAQAYPTAASLMFSVEVETSDAVAQWSAQIEHFLHNSALLSKLRPQVAAFAIEHWSWEKCACQYHKIFEQYILNS